MGTLLTPMVAVVLMYAGVVPSLYIISLLYDDRHKPGVLWFLGLMATAGFWAALFGTFTLVRSPEITLALANFFWAAVPTAAVFTFLIAYEYVHRTVASRRMVIVMFVPVAVLFLLSWTNPYNLVFTEAYGIGPDGFLYAPPLGGPVKILVTKVYGFLLVSFAGGMFLGEALRTSGLRRQQTLSLLLILVALAASTLIKILELVPEYFDPTAAAFSISGLAFAYSIDRHGLLKLAPIARERAFQEVEDLILITDQSDVIVGVNRSAESVFGAHVIDRPLDAVLPRADEEMVEEGVPTVTVNSPDGTRYYSRRESSIEHGRGMEGRLIVLSDITSLKERQEDLSLLKNILARIFRHNMRNDFTVIVGYATEIEKSAGEDIAAKARIIRERTEGLQQRAEKAHELELLFGGQEPVEISLRAVVDHALEPYRETATVSIADDFEDVVLLVHPQFSAALEEIVGNAIIHGEGTTPTTISVTSEIDDGWVVLAFEDDGPGIPAEEIEVLEAEEETSLLHSSGIGLWLVKLIVNRLDGRLEIDSGSWGTRIEIHVPIDTVE